jgi:hypothetical protein
MPKFFVDAVIELKKGFDLSDAFRGGMYGVPKTKGTDR